jgi:hypothetical protein
MTEKHEDDITVEATEVVVDYDAMFASRLRTLEQMIYEFRYRRGLKEGHEDIGAFAQHSGENGNVDFTIRSSHAGHLVVESHGRTVLIDFSSEEEMLEVSADSRTSPIEADAAGVFVLTDIQKKLVDADIDSLDI